MKERDRSQGHGLAGAASADSRLRALILDAWQRTRLDWGFVSDRLARMFRKERHLGSKERRFVAETVYGMVRHLRRIDEALRVGGAKSGSSAPDEARLLAYLVLHENLPVDHAARAVPGIDWQRVASIDERLARESDRARRLALCHSLPDWLSQLMCDDLGERAESLARALNERAPMTVRVNTLRTDVDSARAELAALGLETERGKYAKSALHFVSRTNLFALAPFKKGHFEAQDEGSQLVAELVAPPPKARVVDYCAGAGGKTLALAAHMGNRGRIVATDVAARKLEELTRRARRAGVSNVQRAVIEDGFPGALVALEGRAQRVLLDVPCSGLGALRRNPEARWRLRPEDLARLPVTQLEICERAASLPGPGGRIIYATCTLLRKENEQVVERFVHAHPGFEVMPVKAILGRERSAPITDPTGTFLSVGPDTHGTDGFFAAVLRRVR